MRLLPLLLAIPLAAGCHRDEQPAPSTPPGYAPPGQYTPPGQYAPPPGYAPPGQYVPPPGYAPPGQYTPPPQPTAASPFPWLPPPPAGLPFPFPPLVGDTGQRCVDTVNQYRQSMRLQPLTRWFVAESCTSGEARDSAASGQPHGAFGRCQEMAQNVCPGWSGTPDQMTAPCIQSMWNEGPGGDFATHGHYLNMTSNRFTKVACGYFTGPQGSTWAVLNFQ